ncbi:MAG: ABC-type transport auxiliary lipoprotein family protein [Nitrospiraceae bacterium]
MATVIRWREIRRVTSLLAACALCVALAGCLSIPRETRDSVHTFVLTLDSQNADRPPVKPGDGVLVVSMPQAQPGFESPNIAYMQRPYEIGYYATHQWAESPARLLHPLLVQTFERTGAWRAVVAMPTSVRGDLRLDLDQVVLVQEFLQRPSRVLVSLRAQLLALPSYHVIGSRRFESTEPAPTDDAYGGAVAANRAVQAVVKELGDWLAGCVNARQGGAC